MSSSRIVERVREALAGFSGRLPLFPLPGVVQFPMTVLPLHIFEPRYRAMTRHALDSDKLIGIALLKPGYESDYEGRPPIHPIVCAGRLIHVQERENGTYDLLLEGLARARVTGEEPGGAFRMGQVEILEEPPVEPDDEGLWRQRLDLMLVQIEQEIAAPIRKALGTIINSQLPLGTLLDLVAHAVPSPAEDRQHVLDAREVSMRARLVLELLMRHAGAGDDSPPKSLE